MSTNLASAAWVKSSHHPLTLFILKLGHGYGRGAAPSSGLRTSALFVVDLLLSEGYRAKLVEAIDGNCIDRIVTAEQPARVVLEAIWVTPSKLAELKRLHPRVRWTVRVHSELPFLANEGTAVAWLIEYRKLGVEIAFNSWQTVQDFTIFGASAFLPNYYRLRRPRPRKPRGDRLDVGCFGAIRPMKNQLIQAFAAIAYARWEGYELAFHVNGTRVEQLGLNVLKNIRAALDAAGFALVEHPWMPHEEFLELLCSMDICLQVSLSESFNIVTADAVSMGIPTIGSDAIDWLPQRSRADVSSVHGIVAAMTRADSTTVEMNQEALERYLAGARQAWNAWMGSVNV